MVRMLFILCFSVLTTSVFAQEKTRLKYRACGYHKIIPESDILSYSPENYILEEISEICKSVVLESNFIIRKSYSIDIAVSGVDYYDHRIIFYNPSFFQSHRNKTYQIAILAHEIGHQLNSHTFTNIKTVQDELAADKFAGSVLYKLRLNLIDAKRLLVENCSTQGSLIYPPLSDRVRALITGYDIAGGRIPIRRSTTDGPVVKDIEGNSYPTFKFEGLIWLGTNLRLTMPDAMFYNDIDTAKLYGAYYSFQDAKSVCSKLGKGWRLPSFLEYQHLFGSDNGGYSDYNLLSKNDPHGNLSQGYFNNIEAGSTGFNSILAGYGYRWSSTIDNLHIMAGYWATDIQNNPLEPDYEIGLYQYVFRFESSTPEITKDKFVNHLPEQYSCRCVIENDKMKKKDIHRHR